MAHNNVAADATKRSRARYDNYLVLAIAWDELIRARDGKPEPKSWWFDKASAENFASLYSLPLTALDRILANPITHLMEWMQDPDKAEPVWERVASAVPMMTRSPQSVLVDIGSKSLTEFTADALTGGANVGTDPTTWQLARGAFAMTTRALADGKTEVVLMLDDRAAALQNRGFADEWRLWLKLSNLLGAREQSNSATITTFTHSAKPAPQAAIGPVDLSVVARLQPAWAALLSDATTAERGLLLELSAVDGLAIPDMGSELADGIPVSFSWPSSRFIADFALDDHDHRDLEAAGWTVIPANAASIIAALTPTR